LPSANLFKQNIRILGVDDGPFTFRNKRTVVVGVVVRGRSYVEGVMKRTIRIDGDEATEVLKSMVLEGRFSDQIRVVMIDGIALGGFNVVDMDELSSSIGRPVISVTRDTPDEGRVRGALAKHFGDWERRVEIIERHPLVEVETDYKPVHIKFSGIGEEEAKRIVRGSIVRGCIPEPVRLAHVIASAFVLGESKGSA
jgi:hypothetical protein